MDIQLNQLQQTIVDYVSILHNNKDSKLNRLIFLSGTAGTGKSCVVKELMKFNNNVVVAKTGIAAHNVGGSTINRTFAMDFDGNIKRLNNQHRDVKLLIIDEISMVKGIELDSIDKYFRGVKKNHKIPFGGITVVVIGDFGQLEPIFNNKEDYVYNTPIWSEFKEYTLLENMRQHEEIFTRQLLTVRNGKDVDLKYWNNFVISYDTLIPDDTLFIMATNNDVNSYNLHRLSKLLDSEPIKKSVTLKYNLKIVPHYQRGEDEIIYPIGTEERLCNELKIVIGTRLIITFNNPTCIYRQHNGKLCTVCSLPTYEGGPVGLIDDKDGIEFYVLPIQIKVYSKNKNELCIYVGYPFAYAWAVTIHKIQGITVNKLALHPFNIFAKGQLYVALTRVRTSDGLYLLSPILKKHILPAKTDVCIEKMNMDDIIKHTK